MTALWWWSTAIAIATVFSIASFKRSSRSPDLGLLALVAFAALTFLGMNVLSVSSGPNVGPLVEEKVALHVLIAVIIGLAVSYLLPLVTRALARFGFDELFADGRAAIGAALALLIALAIAGRGPAGSAARINLVTPFGPFQPLEVVKLLLVVAMAQHLGRYRASFAVLEKKRGWAGPWGLVLLAPFVIAFAALMGSAWLFGDFGTVLVLAPTLALISIAASGSVLVAAVLAFGALSAVPVLIFLPWPAHSKVFTRLMTWLVPDTNGLPSGDQLALAQQAIAAGGWSGSSWPAIPNQIPAGTTDLPVALLVERFGVAGLLLFTLAILALVYSGVAIGARLRGRREEIRYVPMALAFLIAVQTVVAVAGLAGLLPLSGIVTPFLSEGGTGMVVFGVAAIAIARYGAIPAGESRAEDDLLPRGLFLGFAATGVSILIALAVLTSFALGDPRRLTEPIPTELEDGRVAPRWGARLRRVIDDIEPVPILDRYGRIVAAGNRSYPYGPALAPITGVARAGIAPLPGTLEAVARESYARFPRRPTAAELVEVCKSPCAGSGPWRPAGVVPEESMFREVLLDRIRERYEGAALRMRPFEAPDFAMLASPLREGEQEVRAALERVRADVPAVRTTIDAELQSGAYALLVEAMHSAKATVGALVVRDAITGHILVHASGESVDPEQLAAGSFSDPKISGAFGALRNIAGLYAVPPGSTFKPIVAAALLDAKTDFHPEPCVHHARRTKRGMQGNLRIGKGDYSGWIADFSIDKPHGALDLESAIEHSCNVWFGQAGVALGAERLRESAARFELASFAVPDEGGVELAAAAVGQGKTLMSAEQVSLVYAAIAGGGVTRSCDLMFTREGGLSCREVSFRSRENMPRIHSALRRVVTGPKATGGRAKEPAGASYRVYGKTGTAEQGLTRGESGPARDHAWFAGWFAGAGERRYAFAILLARGGIGGRGAAPIAPKLGALLEKHGYFDVVAAR